MKFLCVLGLKLQLFFISFFFNLGKERYESVRIKLICGRMMDDNLILLER